MEKLSKQLYTNINVVNTFTRRKVLIWKKNKHLKTIWAK